MYCFHSYGQINNKFWIYGKVIDSAGVVKNANIINLKTKKGTFSNDFGDYKMIVSIGDTVQFTSVQHQTITRVINNFIYTSEVLDVFLPKKTIELEEVVLKRHDLDGFLSVDRNKTPEDRKGEALKRTLDFSNEDMRIVYDGDHIDQKVRPPVVRTDPVMAFVGAGTSLIMPFKYSERLWALRKKVNFQTEFPQMLISEFGEKFFENDLKIPKEKYYHFLEYCNPLGIESLYQKNRKIELINILRTESKKYLKLLEQEVKKD
ncbi:hypothetical protein AAON49_01505 [Pseudotenacibaculum sp. MALMAid0570]